MKNRPLQVLWAWRLGYKEVVLRWCCEPATKLDPGCSEAPPIVAPVLGSTQGRLCNAEHPARAVTKRRREAVEVIYAICAGLDVHKKTVVACLITQGDGGRPKKEIRTFGTMTDEIVKLADWLAATGCTHVAMESTGVYWQPIWNLLEGRFQLMLVNARHIKAVPGRKSDVRDCEWIANLLRHGLLKGSFVPDRQQRELRELTRFRSSLVQERTAHVNRLQKTLESANIKLAAVTSNVAGVSARQMLEALVAGSSDAAAMAQLAKGRLREKIPQLERALVGHFGGHHRYLVPQILASIDFLDERIEDLSRRIAELQRPCSWRLAASHS
jgi:transposase